MKIQRRSVLLILPALVLCGCKQAQKGPAAAGMPTIPVAMAKASQESVPTDLRVVGTVEASAIVQIKAS